MPLVSGYTFGSLTRLLHLTIPSAQHPLASTTLGINNFAPGVKYTQASYVAVGDTSLQSITAIASMQDIQSGSSMEFSLMADTASLVSRSLPETGLAAGQSPVLWEFAEGEIIIPSGALVTVQATSSNWLQASGGLCLSLWGLVIGR